ncbi:DNA mismatch repair protein MutS [Danxiaibacter flavus]|uniref:DNA mismatch repair protein MutS n=1 Tax=Danxiaibacter flavus TaxID=3049108 RepID=A0ABV3ZFW0_9BACT|nr:DNA mismatch repair protein MutS [Chitinophagaceae bacterium DXS]
MQADKTTINDLSIFQRDEELSVFHHFNFARTIGGKDWLRSLFSTPLDTLTDINDTQRIIKRIIACHKQWPEGITNGTIMVVEKFFENQVADIPVNANAVTAALYKLSNGPDYSLIRYSVKHFLDFVRTMHQLVTLLKANDNPKPLVTMLQKIELLLGKPVAVKMAEWPADKKLSIADVLHFGQFVKRHFRHEMLDLVDLYSQLDAYYSMATAHMQYQLAFPEFIESAQPAFEVKELYHPLLSTPVAYDIALSPEQNFLFLTGANMAGKSTFIKAVGVSVFLAHLGMGVPANYMKLSLFDGLLSNIQVEDNIIKGESFFFNEVQRIRKTIDKISDGKKWLILIDELFKGTNVQDAMKCSTTVIEGLRKMKNAQFILSTHLYEIGDSLKQYPNIIFRYFETEVNDDQLVFSYHLKEGISNDRLGYLILKREGVVNMLEKL